MNDRNLLRTGIVGAVFAAVCCFTPLLVIIVSGVGLAAIVGWLDYVLFPALGLFIFLTIYALWRRQRRPRAEAGA